MAVSFDAAKALQLVSSFFEKEWPNTTIEEVELVPATGGLINRLHVLRRHNTDTVADEPVAVLIRHFGLGGDDQEEPEEPLSSSTTLSAVEQAIVYNEMGRRGWGPKIYGTFPGGRLEEWVDAHPLTATESMNDTIRQDIARAYARLHFLHLPLRKDNFLRVVQELTEGVKSRKAEIEMFLHGLNLPEATEFVAIFSRVDWIRELSWTTSLLERYGCKRTVAAWDTNFLNVLVKNYESECRVMLIDFETTTYSYRGLDIGGHFTERMYNWGRPESKYTGVPAPDIEEQRSFCQSYLQEMKELGQLMTANDTVDHLLLEADIGRMYMLLSVVLTCLVVDETEDDPYFLSTLTHMTNTYFDLKEKF